MAKSVLLYNYAELNYTKNTNNITRYDDFHVDTHKNM